MKLTPRSVLALRLLCLSVAFMVIGIAIDVSIKANLGVGAWTVFHLGIAAHTGLTQGQVSQAVGLGIIAASYFLGIKPAVGTVLNMLLIGWFFDASVALRLIPPAFSVTQGLFYLIAATLLMGFGGAMYMSAGLGAGPRDSLMLALIRRTTWPVRAIRTGMELTVLALGWLLGGPVGVGTVLLSVSLGPAVELCFELFRVLTAHSELAGTVIDVPVPKTSERKSANA
ncbi:MAG: membrane protein [Selenomonadales bacterium]|nr:membrane protein [Selenomonadales bacterium]